MDVEETPAFSEAEIAASGSFFFCCFAVAVVQAPAHAVTVAALPFLTEMAAVTGSSGFSCLAASAAVTVAMMIAAPATAATPATPAVNPHYVVGSLGGPFFNSHI